MKKRYYPNEVFHASLRLLPAAPAVFRCSLCCACQPVNHLCTYHHHCLDTRDKLLHNTEEFEESEVLRSIMENSSSTMCAVTCHSKWHSSGIYSGFTCSRVL